jgi:hypothetical protein
LKYLVISVLLGVAFILIYSRLRPYIQMIRKVANMINSPGTTVPPGSSSRRKTAIENKLVRCAGCEIWFPAGRSVGSRAGLSAYCSNECLEKAASGKKHKMAG